MKKSTMYKKMAMVTLLIGINFSALAVIDAYTFDNPRQEAQYRALIEEFRCPKCQNQNLAGSDAPIAQDLKKKTYEMVKDGRSDTEIRNYMNERYGDFISYKPPVRPSTWILWFLPPVILLLGLVGWLLRQRYRKKPVLSPTSLSDNANFVTGDKLGINEIRPLDNDLADLNTENSLTPLSAEEKARLESLLNTNIPTPTAIIKE